MSIWQDIGLGLWPCVVLINAWPYMFAVMDISPVHQHVLSSLGGSWNYDTLEEGNATR